MRSLKQIEASRANGAKSRGRASETAGQAAERNSFRYGLLAGTVVLPGESNERFLEMVQTLAGQFKPANEAEAALLDTMAMARWRQLRVVGLQRAATEMEMARQEGPAPNRALEALKDHNGSLAALQRNEMAYSRQFDSALRMLLRLKEHHIIPGPASNIELTSAGATFHPEPEEDIPPLE